MKKIDSLYCPNTNNGNNANIDGDSRASPVDLVSTYMYTIYMRKARLHSTDLSVMTGLRGATIYMGRSL